MERTILLNSNAEGFYIGKEIYQQDRVSIITKMELTECGRIRVTINEVEEEQFVNVKIVITKDNEQLGRKLKINKAQYQDTRVLSLDDRLYWISPVAYKTDCIHISITPLRTMGAFK